MEIFTTLPLQEDGKILPSEETYLEERTGPKGVDNETLQHNFPHISRIWFNVTQPSEFHYERKNEMEALQKYWNECINNPTKLVFVEIKGLPFVGKTEFTRNFVNNFHIENKGHCVWINGENTKSISDSFRRLAIELRISLKDSLGKEKPFNFLLKDIYKLLFNSECIIVFDHLEDYNHPFLITLIEVANKQPLLDGKPFLLLISRNGLTKAVFPFETKKIQLYPFTPEFGTSFIAEKMNFSDKDGKCIALAEILAEKLKYNPLAMAQAVAYMEKRRKSLSTEKNIQKYLNSLDQEEEKISCQLKNLDDHSKVTRLTLEVSMKKIMKLPVVGLKGKMAMYILSFFAADTVISINFAMDILGAIPTPNVGIKSAIRSSVSFKPEIEIFKFLHDYLLCQGVAIGKDNFILIQRNVQEIIRGDLEEREETMGILHVLLEVIGKNLTRGEIPISQMIHIETVWKYAVDNRLLVQKHGNFPQKIVSKYLGEGKFREAFDFSCSTVKALEDVFGEDNRLTLKMKYLKGVAYKERKEFNDSFQLLEEVYEKEKSLFGAEDHDCLLTARELGVVLLQQKKLEDAKILLEDTQKIRERVSGPEHRETLKLIGDVACVHYVQRKNEEAVKIYEKLEEMEERIFGTEDRRTLSTKHNIATVKFHEGQYNDALQIFHQVLQVKERILELDHPDVLETKIWLAVTYKCLGRHEDGLKLARETRDRRVKILGMEDELTISAEELIAELEAPLKRSSLK